MELIRIENIYKTYHLGEIDVPVLNGVSFSIQPRRNGRPDGRLRLRQNHADEHSRLPRPPQLRQILARRRGDERAHAQPAGAGAHGEARLRVPKLQSPAAHHGHEQRAHAAGLFTRTDSIPPKSKHRALELLDRVGLSDRLDHEPSQMSGGQQQRVAIARALINGPALLLADEPTGNLDSHTSVEILRMFQQLNAAGITVILVTHDPKVASYAHRMIRIADGLIESDTANQPGSEADLASASGPHRLRHRLQPAITVIRRPMETAQTNGRAGRRRRDYRRHLR